MFGTAAYLLTGIKVKFPHLGPNTNCTIAIRGRCGLPAAHMEKDRGGFVHNIHRMSQRQPLKMLTPNQAMLMSVLWPERGDEVPNARSLESCSRSGCHNLGGIEKTGAGSETK